jgi:hypothetical protein
MKNFLVTASADPVRKGQEKYGAAPITQGPGAQASRFIPPPLALAEMGSAAGRSRAGGKNVGERPSPCFVFAQESLASPSKPR